MICYNTYYYVMLYYIERRIAIGAGAPEGVHRYRSNIYI